MIGAFATGHPGELTCGSLPFVSVNVKWGKEKFDAVELNTEEPPMVFKAQLFALTGVQPDRQKVMVKGGTLKVLIQTTKHVETIYFCFFFYDVFKGLGSIMHFFKCQQIQ